MSLKVSIDTDEIDSWRAEVEGLKREVAERQKKIIDLEGDIEAALRLANRKQRRTIAESPVVPKGGARSIEPPQGSSMTDALEMIANRSAAPLTKQEIRDQLSGQGFADKGPYLYTVIMRLKDRGKISVMSDGKVWKAPSQQ
jgi:hypothetical protein